MLLFIVVVAVQADLTARYIHYTLMRTQAAQCSTTFQWNIFSFMCMASRFIQMYVFIKPAFICLFQVFGNLLVWWRFCSLPFPFPYISLCHCYIFYATIVYVYLACFIVLILLFLYEHNYIQKFNLLIFEETSFFICNFCCNSLYAFQFVENMQSFHTNCRQNR